MQTAIFLVSNTLISLFITGASLWVLSKPLINILSDLCPTQTQADFWLSYTRIMLFISPLFMVLVFDGFVSSDSAIEHARVSIVSGLSGLLVAMIIIGRRILTPTSQQSEGWGS